MSQTQYQGIREWVEGRECRASNLFSEGDVLYSYGRHYKLAVKRKACDSYRSREWVVVNGSWYSKTTAQHQGTIHRVLAGMDDLDVVTVGGNSLFRAGLEMDTAILVDYREDSLGYGRIGDEAERTIPVGATVWRTYQDKDRSKGQYKWHLLGGCVLESPSTGAHYLCAMDERQYFVAGLPVKVICMGEAVDALKPPLVKLAERTKREVRRQGEWFFVKVIGDWCRYSPSTRYGLDINIPFTRVVWGNSLALPHDTDSNTHVVTRLGVGIDRTCVSNTDMFLCQGIVRHRTRWGRRADHANLKLEPKGSTWVVVKNTEVDSWTEFGVD